MLKLLLHNTFNFLTLRLRSFFLLFSLSLTCALSALPELSRHYAYRYFSTRDGLAQMQLICAFQDRDGYLWFGTKGGVSRWDGKAFKNYTPEDGLPYGEIRNISEWGSRRIIFSSRKMTLLYENDSLEVISLPQGMLYPNASPLTLPIDKDNIFVLGLVDENKQEDSSKRYNFRFNLRTKQFVEIKNFDKKVRRVNENNIICSNAVYSWEGKKIVRRLNLPFEIYQGIFDKNFEKCALQKPNTNQFQLFKREKKNFVLMDSLRIVESVHRCSWFPDGTFLSLTTHGYFFYPAKPVKLFDKMTFPNFSFVDKENNLWIGTENGLYNFFNLNIQEYSFGIGEPDNIWSIIQDKTGKMWFGSFGNGLITLNVQQKTQVVDFRRNIMSLKQAAANQIYMGSTTHNINVYIATATGVVTFNDSKFSSFTNTPACLYTYFDKQLNELLYCALDTVTGKRGLYIGVDINRKFYPFEVGFPVCIIRDGNNKIRVGAFRGTGTLENEKLVVDTVRRPYVGVVSMALDNQKRLWKATEKGIYVELVDGSEFRVSSQQLTGAFTALAVYKNKYLIVGGTHGFAIVNIVNNSNYENLEVVNIGYDAGFTGLESGQNGICVDSKGFVWLSTALNVLKFNPEDIVKNQLQHLPKLRISQLAFSSDNSIWHNYFFSNGAVKIASDYKFFRFDYIANSISAPNSLRFRYRLVGFSDKWSEPVRTKSVSYTNIGYGKYRFEVQCSLDGKRWSPVVQSPEIEITVPFYMHPLAYIAYLMFIIIVSVLLTRQYSHIKQAKQVQELNRIKLENELQLKSIRSKIIPHFTKNVLSAIGHFAMTEKLKAGHYIAVFYKFSEKTLTLSDKNFITLSDELEYIKLYLELEKMRFEDKDFNYNIHLSDEINTQMLVPALTLHTYCDNAIRHGLINKPHKGWKLTIAIDKTDAGVLLSVTDNGIGRKNAAQLGTQGARQGLSLIDQQLAFYNTQCTVKMTQHISDLTDSQGQALGTRVELFIPHSFQFAN